MTPNGITVVIVVATLVVGAVYLLRDRIGPFEVVIRGNSATNRELEPRVDGSFYSRWGARRYARILNSGPTGTGIFKAEVRRRAR